MTSFQQQKVLIKSKLSRQQSRLKSFIDPQNQNYDRMHQYHQHSRSLPSNDDTILQVVQHELKNLWKETNNTDKPDTSTSSFQSLPMTSDNKDIAASNNSSFKSMKKIKQHRKGHLSMDQLYKLDLSDCIIDTKTDKVKPPPLKTMLDPSNTLSFFKPPVVAAPGPKKRPSNPFITINNPSHSRLPHSNLFLRGCVSSSTSLNNSLIKEKESKPTLLSPTTSLNQPNQRANKKEHLFRSTLKPIRQNSLQKVGYSLNNDCFQDRNKGYFTNSKANIQMTHLNDFYLQNRCDISDFWKKKNFKTLKHLHFTTKKSLPKNDEIPQVEHKAPKRSLKKIIKNKIMVGRKKKSKITEAGELQTPSEVRKKVSETKQTPSKSRGSLF